MRWIKKWMQLFDVHDELYHPAKFGEDRTMRAGYRCENVVFVFCLFVCFLVTLVNMAQWTDEEVDKLIFLMQSKFSAVED